LRGTVAGATACELVADSDEIVVGTDPACDLPVLDPIMPSRAFRLRRIKCHSGTEEECRCHWILESSHGARVYVNQQIARRERLRYGDVVDSGCHHFVFTSADSASRNRRLHQNVADLCERLLAEHAAPIGFVRSGPFHRYACRLRRGLSVAGILAALLLMLAVLIPQEEVFESIMPPLEIQVAETTMISPEAVRSLNSVKRQDYRPTEPPPDSPALAEKPVTPPPDPASKPRLRDVAEVEAPTLTAKPVEFGELEPRTPMIADTTAQTRMERNVARLEPSAAEPRRALAPASLSVETARLADYSPAFTEVASLRAMESVATASRPDLLAASANPHTWQLPILPPTPVKTADTTVRRESVGLTGSAPPVRRLSVSETVQMSSLAGETAGLRTRTVSQPASGPVTRAAVRDVLAALQKPTTDGLKADPSKTFEQLAAYKASPVGFESFRGMQVPVVRISEQLLQIETPGVADKIKLDGTVSKDEIAVSWKSGRFHTHAPGQPPPEADPPTYCYVGRTEMNGKPCLYVAFTCVDPDVSQIVAMAGGGNSTSLIRDDSIEIFLDTNCDRKDYYQIIANAKGAFWSGYYPKPAIEGKTINHVQAWDAGATVKTSVTRDPSQWVCEIVIPFDRLGGVPAKGTRWAVNFARNYRGQIKDWQLQSWFAVYDKDRNYHHPNLFGIFQW
jgi:hypothetical protein